MSNKNNVNPNHYKTGGRDRQGEDIVQEAHRQKLNQAQSAAESGQSKFIPGTSQAKPEDGRYQEGKHAGDQGSVGQVEETLGQAKK